MTAGDPFGLPYHEERTVLDSLSALGPGKVFHGRYEVVRCIKAGGMGAVYEVIHLETKRRRALKVMLPSIVRDANMRDRFRLEAQVTADVESDHIVETFDAGVDAETGAPFLVMELLRGEDLAHVVETRGHLPAEEVVAILNQLARALEQTHSRGIVHRDLKPENLFIAVRGEDPARLKVLDFGIAKVVAQSTHGGATTSLGTPLYMAPEQFEGAEVSSRTDLFAVGHIAFTLLVGQPYWREEAETLGGILPLIQRLAKGSMDPACGRALRLGVALPAAFDAWFKKSTARAAKDRFQKATPQIAALAEALGVEIGRGTVPAPAPSANVAAPAPIARGQTEAAPDAVTAIAPANERAASELPTMAGTSPGASTGWDASGAPPSSDPAFAATSAHGSGEVAPLSAAQVAAGITPPVATRDPASALGAATNHAAVTSIPELPRPARTRVVVVAAVSLAVVAAAALGIQRLSSHSSETNAPSSAAPTTKGEQPTAPVSASAPPPQVEPASVAPSASAAQDLSSKPSAAPSSAPPKSSPLSTLPPQGAPRVPPKKRDPTRVFE